MELMYKIGKPCKRGHTLRYAKSRHCVACESLRYRKKEPPQEGVTMDQKGLQSLLARKWSN